MKKSKREFKVKTIKEYNKTIVIFKSQVELIFNFNCI